MNSKLTRPCSPFARVFFIAILLSGCSVAASRFAESPYGQEIQQMMEQCKRMQVAGELQDVNGGDDRSLVFESEPVDYASKDDVSYPLRHRCKVADGNVLNIFMFTKASEIEEWTLAP